MASSRSTKDKEMASHLKKMGVQRKSAACPMHCGNMVTIGGGPLVSHLNFCRGTKRKGARV